MITKNERITGAALANCSQESSEIRFRVIFENALDGILLLDDNGRYIDANPSACAIFGRVREHLLGAPVTSNCEFSDWNRFLNEGSARGEMRVRRPDGTLLQIEYSGKAHVQPGQQLMLIRDVTEKKRLEAQLRQSQKMEAVGRLAGGVAHDFNNMLTVIRGYSELLQSRAANDKVLLRYATSILNAAERSAVITQQLLAFSRRQVIQPQVVCLNLVVEDTMRLLGRVIGEDIRVELNLSSDLAEVKVDPGQMGQIVVNLAVNARDAMPHGGRLRISTENRCVDHEEVMERPGIAAGEYVVLEMADSGCGMDRETQSHIFEPFFTTKPQGKGTGLGLATVYGIVKQSGGWIYVSSAVDHGTRFEIFLPRWEPPSSDSIINLH
jgi:two-component system, cell cycle sensor histidine kinase and response regulator CckA